ncbi:SA1788 family PVL leukocidin-associated protein [Staphylococcus capitis]|uniref:SA1788 family PVL leukocidin-associated protein n=1 Tax=Staphylococcus capitis TaxID=29388 RepID=UPI000CD2F41A|nr:SA1788 family PVL leukocidin-associated protein [Staphylococcus capitis]PNY89623.1 hypothetical protein CD156_03290 [Staphylococcus capitis subsp. urealyticus]
MFVVKGQEYEFTNEILENMELIGIKEHTVKNRLSSGWGFDDAIQAPIGTTRAEWSERKALKLKAEKLKQSENERLKRKKPHLFTVPQKHPRGKWCKHLMENDIFPKKVAR